MTEAGGLIRRIALPTAAHEFLARDHGLTLTYSSCFQAYSYLMEGLEDYRPMPPFLPNYPGLGFWIEARMGTDLAFVICGRIIEGRLNRILASWDGSWDIPETVTLEGTILVNGGTWVAPAYRGQKRSVLAVKLLHAAALIKFSFDYSIGLVVPAMWEKGLSQEQGFRHHEMGIRWTGYYPETQDLYLIWADRREILRSLT